MLPSRLSVRDCPSPAAGQGARTTRAAGRRDRAAMAGSPALRAFALLAIAVAAVVIDGRSPAAWAYIERCAAADSFAALAGMALRLDAHLQAFPATALAMFLLCAAGPGKLRRWLLMLVAMVPVCVLAWWLAAGLPAGVQAHAFAAGMLVLPWATGVVSHRWRRGWARMDDPAARRAVWLAHTSTGRPP